MEYRLNSVEEIKNSETDAVNTVYSGNGITVESYNIKKNSAIIVNDDLPDYTVGERRTICYICESGSIEFWIGSEKIILNSGSTITICPDEVFSIWALENSFFYAIHNNVENEVDLSMKQLVDAVHETELKDKYLKGHNYRVGKYSTLIMQIVNPLKATTPFHIAATYHDVGKNIVPSDILNKNGKLTKEEFDEIKKHPAESYEILRKYLGDYAAGFARWHHEKLDGSGYPDGISSEMIPLESKVMAVADIFDALTTSRCYRPSYSFAEAIEILYKDAENGKIEKSIVEVLAKLISEGKIVDGQDNQISINN